MALCASCASLLSGDAALCPQHHAVVDDAWAANNRIICDLIHRGKPLKRLGAKDRADEYWATTLDPPGAVDSTG